MDYCLKCTEPLNGQVICPNCGFHGEMPVLLHQLRPGTVLYSRYLVGGPIGQGGFGITYVGRDLKLDMRIAIKEYYPNGFAIRNNRVSSVVTVLDKANSQYIEGGIQKFLAEAKVLARFDGEPGVVCVRDFFEENKTAYIIMEYLDGLDLRTILQERLFPANEIFQMMLPVMNTLEKIHASGVIHRDISPDNLMLLKDGRLKLMDFGSARLVDYSDQRSLSVVLKAGFAPEEQYRSKGIQGPWTDIYALCATIYKCITGITPDDALDRGYQDNIQWPSELNIPISERQEAVLKKGLAFRSDDRFKNIAEMRQALIDPAEGQGSDFNSGSHSLPSTLNASTVHAPSRIPRKTIPLVSPELPDTPVASGADTPVFDRQGPTVPLFTSASGSPTASEQQNELEEKEVEEVKHSDKVVNNVKQKPTGNKAKKQKKIIPVIAILAVLIISVSILFIIFGSKGPVFNMTLSAPESLSDAEYKRAQEILRGRLDTFAGEGNYDIEVDGRDIELSIPQKAFGNCDPKKAMEGYISRAMELYIYGNDYTERIHLSRNDLENVTQMRGSIDGADVSSLKLAGNEYDYIEVVLTDECSETISRKFPMGKEELKFSTDMENVDKWYYHFTYPKGDDKTFYIIDNVLGGRYPETFVYDLLREPLPDNFELTIN